MYKKIFAVFLAVCLAFTLTACSFSSSSSSTVSSTVNGETTTTTTTTENGETHTETTTTTADGNTTTTVDGQTVDNGSGAAASADDPTGLRAQWHETFTGGAEGTNDDGEHFYFIYDNAESISLAAMMITSPDGSTLSVYDYGEVLKDDNGAPYINDVEGVNSLPFEIVESNENGFVFGFQNGVQTQFSFVDLDTIVNDMITIWEGVKAGNISYAG